VKSKLNIFFSVFLALVVISRCNATVLYVRYTSSEIIIATDSKRTLDTGQTVCVCKLSRINDTFIASAGLAEYGSFDPKDFALQAIQSSSNLKEVRDRFEQLIQQPLIDVLKKLRNRNPSRYEIFKRGAAVNMVFVRFVDGPELAASALTPRDNKDGSITLDSHPITLSGPVKRAQRISVGISKRAEVFLDRPSFWAVGTVAAVQRVMQLSVEDNSEAGGPADLVQLTKGSVRWVPREPQCDDRSRRINEQLPSCNSSISPP
jgi:hypothetical protein